MFFPQLMWLRFEQGSMEDEEYEAFVNSVPGVLSWQAWLAVADVEAGRVDAARERFQSLATNLLADAPRDYVWLTGVAGAGWVVPPSVTPTALRRGILAPYRGHTAGCTSISMGPVDSILATLATTLGRWDEAESEFASAAELCERQGMPAWLARTHLEYARMLMARQGPGDADRAHGFAAQACETAESLGMERVAADARHVLTVVG